MFNYPNLRPQPIAAIEQRCGKCDQWFPLDAKAVAAVQSMWNSKGGLAPMHAVTCTHCGSERFAVPVGKYDRPGIAKEQCAVQFVVLAVETGSVKA